MELSSYEQAAIKKYISAIGPTRLHTDAIEDCRWAVIHVLQSICIIDYKLTDKSDEFKEPAKYVMTTKQFFGSYDATKKKWVAKNDLLKTVNEKISKVLSTRNEGYNPATASNLIVEEDDRAEEAKNSAKAILKWYLNHHHSYQLSSIDNLTYDEKISVQHLFTGKTNILIEGVLKERENYYVILLVDSSQSMLWPYLSEQSNANNDTSPDYKNAVKQVQNAIQKAHELLLTGFRGSFVCKKRYLNLYQYVFNQEGVIINTPELLQPVGTDKVTKIDSSNYIPEGATALYNTLEESINVIYNDYLKKSLEKGASGIVHKVAIGIITDGEDTYIDGISKFKSPEAYEEKRKQKIKSINVEMQRLRGNGDVSQAMLVSSVLIGLTGTEFSELKLKEMKRELNFDEAISINQANDQSIRKAFKLFSTNALNI